jgi:hypothetical protein
MLGDIPLGVFKYNLINSVPLLDLERAFEKVHYRTFADDCSPYEAALKEVPDLVLGLSDEYLAAMIYKASETYKNIMVICGYGQTRSIPHYLYYNQQANLDANMKEVASYKPVFETLIRRDNPETQLDKLVIVDNLLGLTSPGAIDPITLSLIN